MKLTFLVITVLSLFSAIVLSRELHRRPFAFSKKGLGDIWSNCTAKDDIMNIDFVKITPDEVKQNSDLNVFVKYNLKRPVTDGTVSITGIPIIGSLTMDVCDALQSIGITCPVKEGDGSFNVTQTIPDLGSSYTFNGGLTAKDEKGNEILCIKLNFTLHE